ncbi:extensin family protein [Rhodoblastus acidophilus]|uniref:Extensin family protein n=1 Tax=Candidatus Rhodoblastus alkanivorans TaxID=2954117 RepID=A0ABS9ZBG0_9HYPH|nr:extensin family protein [Candidatus Rhodoblastus alkanivorans]MCI4680560.1 extensin family protein [Candidatus Rhodoblastus alkanivorans]MCI4683977.1 extensin family protein [Candidatus Rhodoblastus alkanivorans]MDI4641296.1 extensin family protein [Rhodoblastus acidophilus]
MRVSWAICAFALTAGSAVAAVPAPPRRPADFLTAVAPPLPPPRPTELSPPPAPPPAPVAERPENPAACDSWLASGEVEATRRAPIAGPNGCGVEAPVALDAVILPDKRRVPIEPPPVLRCDFAAEAARWIAQDLVPSLEAGGERVVRLAGVGGYECRTRDRQPGAPMSEHAHGDAIDLTSVVFADGRVFSLASRANDLVLASKLRASACELFSTVLGPGADGAHESHVHFDLEPRRHGGKICEWDLR